MKKHSVLFVLLFVAMSAGNAFGTTTLGGCCSGTSCIQAYTGDNCKPCTTSAQCGGTISTCPDECPNTTWTLVSNSGVTYFNTARYEAKCLQSLMGGTAKCQYRCAAGSYGNPTSSSEGCSRCPYLPTTSLVANMYGESNAGSTDITDCYAPVDNTYSDSTGKFQFTEDCYYTK